MISYTVPQLNQLKKKTKQPPVFSEPKNPALLLFLLPRDNQARKEADRVSKITDQAIKRIVKALILL